MCGPALQLLAKAMVLMLCGVPSQAGTYLTPSVAQILCAISRIQRERVARSLVDANAYQAICAILSQKATTPATKILWHMPGDS